MTKCSGEGIYFAAKSGRMCAEAIVEDSNKGTQMVSGFAFVICICTGSSDLFE